eukprot:TRINITY_DN37401_c0_g1_i4.p1 TRINITY_DN37401_c0_g1~~TRINITY_DN37401_c0_g1_i4.p1  ORF type:complete len:143 (+),score=10.23 TRINITY_DN37401_c0_g1_i4:93-521(+)
MAHSGAARAGVENLTKSLALEWADKGIRVNAVAPGITFSETARSNYASPTFMFEYASKVPSKRLGTVEETSSLVCFLLSPGASYISGCTMHVDGLWHLQLPYKISSHNSWPVYGTLPIEGFAQIGRAVQQECRDRSRMPSSA